ncbi:sporangiospore maturation cell wall hydrolase GsmA [Krasilnikovia sp. MM14-A1004]|uniref:sporangiospore maturation cell wall hydrolase GsmA n=1 Tax=Krasilnikovia sp. MM14-A1004 TaxID=3373541 RepID=UPI00399D271F
MLHTARRMLTAPALAVVIGAGLLVAPQAANAASVAATVDVVGTLRIRTAPSLAAPIVGAVHDEQRVAVECATRGTEVRGSQRTTDVWDRLGTDRYISHAYVRPLGTIASCAAIRAQAQPVKVHPAPVQAAAAGAAKATAVKYTVGRIRSSDGRVNVRAGVSLTSPVRGTLANGARVNLVCGVVGARVKGTVRTTTQWNRLSNGLYVSHAYVVTPTLHLCPGAPRPVQSTPALTPEQFIARSVSGAQRGWRDYGVPPSVTIAQAILESGWGRSDLSVADRNFFGIKCFNGNHGPLASGCHTYQTQECTKAGKCFVTTASFRTYASQANSYRDHGYFLRVNSRYKPAFKYTRSANKFIWTVWKAGYATDPNYYTKITGIMSRWGLYRYDTWK